MNYFKNKKYNLVKFTQGSILLTSITAPTILNIDSANAMLGSLTRNLSRATTATTPSVSSLVSTFEKISQTSQKTSLKNSTKPKSVTSGFNYLNPSLPATSTSSKLPAKSNTIKPQLKFSTLKLPSRSTTPSLSEKSSSTPNLPTIVTARGFTYLYSNEPSSSAPVTHKNITPQNTTTPSKVKIHTTSTTPNTNNTTSYTKSTTSSSTSTNNNQRTPRNLTYTLELGSQLPHKYPTFELPSKQTNDLELMIKANIATMVKQNLPQKFSKNQPITLHFDSEAGDRLNAALTSFMYRSAIRTLESINKQ